MICDLQNNAYFYVPNDLYTFLSEYDGRLINEILHDFEEGDKDTVMDYITFLLDRDLIFFTQNPDLFPPLSLEWDEPALVTNAIIDYWPTSDFSWGHLLSELESVGCRDVQIRFYEEISNGKLEEILNIFDKRRIKSLELLIKYHRHLSDKYLTSLTISNLRIKTVFVHSSPKDLMHTISKPGFMEDGMGNIIYLKQKIENNLHCGNVSSLYFSINTKTFTESLKYNSCLNRKVGIDGDGSIKNCPSLEKIFGNIKTDKLVDIIARTEFQSVWSMSKDKIDVCKDCEHRYICTDCRAFTVGNEYDGKPFKCKYDPYTALWKE